MSLQGKEQEYDQAEIKMALQAKEIESLKLQVEELADYRKKYEEQSQVQLRSKETEIEELHTEMATLTGEHSTHMTQVNQEKELLITQNSQLKKELAESKLEEDLLKSEVERFHTQM